MKFLVVTGKLAEKSVNRRVQESGVEAEVITMPIEVAALIPHKLIHKSLLRKDLSDVKSILIPGLLAGDVSWIGEKIGVNIFKGPKNAADLPQVLKDLENNTLSLSTITPACELIRETAYHRTEDELKSIYEKASREVRTEQAIPIGSDAIQILIGRELPPVVLAEIVDAPILSDDEIKKAAIRYASSGADIIDIGMIAGGDNPDKAKSAVQIVKKTVPKPVSIDTADLREMEAAVDAGVDLILSLNGETLQEARFNHDIPIVITPSTSGGSCPTKVDEKVTSLEQNIRAAKRLGYKRIIADPVLTPLLTPSLTESLASYWKFAKRNPRIPLLFGAGNVIELMDADSYGASLLLAGLGYELQASILLITEASRKTQGCVKELSKALRMMLLAKNRGSPPKDLGINLLALKDKIAIDEEPPIRLKDKILTPEEGYQYAHDPKGYFKVILNRESGEIQLVHYSYKGKKPAVVIQGRDPMNLCNTAISRGLISRLDHAAYIGIELLKAHLAIQTGKGYIQDKPLFEA